MGKSGCLDTKYRLHHYTQGLCHSGHLTASHHPDGAGDLLLPFVHIRRPDQPGKGVAHTVDQHLGPLGSPYVRRHVAGADGPEKVGHLLSAGCHQPVKLADGEGMKLRRLGPYDMARFVDSNSDGDDTSDSVAESDNAGHNLVTHPVLRGKYEPCSFHMRRHETCRPRLCRTTSPQGRQCRTSLEDCSFHPDAEP